jgi:hypothetical protein
MLRAVAANDEDGVGRGDRFLINPCHRRSADMRERLDAGGRRTQI